MTTARGDAGARHTRGRRQWLVSAGAALVAVLGVGLLAPESSAAGASSVSNAASVGLAQPLAAASPDPHEATDEEVAKIMLQDPRSREAVIARDAWDLVDGSVNVAGLWFDKKALENAVKAAVRNSMKGQPRSLVETRARQAWARVLKVLKKGATLSSQMSMRGVTYEDNPGLFEKLGLDKTVKLLQFIAANTPRGLHSEIRILAHLSLALRQAGMSPEVIEDLLNKVIIAAYSDRAFCEECAKALHYAIVAGHTQNALLLKNALTIAAYFEKLQRVASANRVGTGANLALAALRKANNAAEFAAATAAASGLKEANLSPKEYRDRQVQIARLQEFAKQRGRCPTTGEKLGSTPRSGATQPGGGAPQPGGGAPQPGGGAPQPGGAVGGGGALGAGALGAVGRVLPAQMIAASCAVTDDPAVGGLAEALVTPVAGDAYGGIDFSTMQMEFVSDNPSSAGLQYSFSAKQVEDGFQQNNALGTKVLQTSAADLRTWLILNPSKYWVNLNPTEPDRIIDEKFGQTNAGRVLLEADFEMKRTSARLYDPKTPTGSQFWARMAGSSDSGTTCFSSRLWIEPGKVQVREDGDSLYILKAPLVVKTESEHLGGGFEDACPARDPVADAKNAAVDRELIIPKVEKAVNQEPEYAPLRRAFMARVVAEWIRGRYAEGHKTSFDDVINSEEVGSAKLQDGWRPRQVFDDYVKALKSKEFSYKQTFRQGNEILTHYYTVGGVDMTQLKLAGVSAAVMSQLYPKLPQDTRASISHPKTAADGSIWLGGTAYAPQTGRLTKIKDTITESAAGKGGMLAVVLVGVGVLLFGFRAGTRRKPRPTDV